MKLRYLILLATLSSFSTFAGETAKGSNFMVLDNQTWPTGEESGFYLFNGTGISNVVEGPTETAAIECHGSGFWGPEGTKSHGVCIHGVDSDQYTSSYKREQGQSSGMWEITHGTGTGKYLGIAGQGTYTTNMLPGGRAISNWQGEITLPQ